MRVPDIPTAERLLTAAGELNAGPWVAHSMYAAKAAMNIAACCSGLDPDVAYVLGCLHDIGRREGVTHLRHTTDGYRYLCREGHQDAARICLTHSFPERNLASYFGAVDCDSGDLRLLAEQIALEYSPYDRLIQLCDCLALPTGFCLVEKRMVDVALRHGTSEHTAEKWRAVIAIQREFEALMGRSIYSALPGVVESTFGRLPSTDADVRAAAARPLP